MSTIDELLFGLLLAAFFIYIIFLRPKYEKSRNDLIFDNRVLGFIDGLYLADIDLGCTDFEMRSYVKDQLSKAHDLPDNQFLIEYTTAHGYRFHSRTGNNDHALFAILCIAQYAKEHCDAEVASWCEANLLLASKDSIHY